MGSDSGEGVSPAVMGLSAVWLGVVAGGGGLWIGDCRRSVGGGVVARAGSDERGTSNDGEGVSNCELRSSNCADAELWISDFGFWIAGEEAELAGLRGVKPLVARS